MTDLIPLKQIAEDLNIELTDELTVIGDESVLMWIDIEKLLIDPSFQRKILRQGRRNIVKIATKFDWNKFGAIQVADLEGQYAIVDGQHRTVSAFLRGITKIPCNVIKASRIEQALAFVSINSNITSVSPLITFKAEVAAGLEDSVKLVDICARGGVTINYYPVDSKSIKPGYTIALGCIKKCLKEYGEDHLVFSLRSITETATDKNRGLLKNDVIKAFCHVYDLEPALKSENSIQLLKTLQLQKVYDNSVAESRKKRVVYQTLAIKLMEFFEEAGAI